MHMPAAKKKAKKAVKKAAPKKAAAKAPAKGAKPAAAQKPIGQITHFFDKISVAVVKLNAGLKVGDRIRIEGHGQSFTQPVTSMQIEHDQITAAKKGQEVGMKIAKPAKAGDLVYPA